VLIELIDIKDDTLHRSFLSEVSLRTRSLTPTSSLSRPYCNDANCRTRSLSPVLFTSSQRVSLSSDRQTRRITSSFLTHTIAPPLLACLAPRCPRLRRQRNKFHHRGFSSRYARNRSFVWAPSLFAITASSTSCTLSSVARPRHVSFTKRQKLPPPHSLNCCWRRLRVSFAGFEKYSGDVSVRNCGRGAVVMSSRKIREVCRSDMKREMDRMSLVPCCLF
jgi:hypothetical protein